jgi:hypothetical protein
MRLGWYASASVEKDPGSLGYARDDTKSAREDTERRKAAQAILYRCPTIGTVLLEDAA